MPMSVIVDIVADLFRCFIRHCIICKIECMTENNNVIPSLDMDKTSFINDCVLVHELPTGLSWKVRPAIKQFGIHNSLTATFSSDVLAHHLWARDQTKQQAPSTLVPVCSSCTDKRSLVATTTHFCAYDELVWSIAARLWQKFL
jgi:hypothetical protein